MLNPVIFLWNIRGIIYIALYSCCVWIACTLVLSEGASSHKKTAYVDGDIMIGALVGFLVVILSAFAPLILLEVE